MYVSVMEKSCYKERFTFADPLSMTSASHTTRYRTRKRRIVPQEPSEGEGRDTVTTQYADSVEFECESDSDSDEELCHTSAESAPNNSMPASVVITPEAVSLYEGSTLTTSVSSLLIMQFKRYQLSKGVDLLRLIRLHCPSPNQYPSSLYLFNKQFQEAKLSVIPHYFCSTCLQKIDDGHVAHCPNPIGVVEISLLMVERHPLLKYLLSNN